MEAGSERRHGICGMHQPPIARGATGWRVPICTQCDCVSLATLGASLSPSLASRLESSLSLRSFLFPLASGGHWAGRTPLSYQRVRTNPGQRDCSREPFSTDSGTWSTLIVPMPAGGARWSLCRGCALAPVRVRVVVCRASVRVRVGQQQLTTDGPKPTFR